MNNHTLTVKIADRGTLYASEEGEFGYSTAGHMWIELFDGEKTDSMGFAPKEPGIRSAVFGGEGNSNVDDDKDAYIGEAYSITIPITKEEYDKLTAFRDSPKEFGFNTDTYKAARNSCIDYVWSALNTIDIKHPLIKEHEGRVMPKDNSNGVALAMQYHANSEVKEYIDNFQDKMMEYQEYLNEHLNTKEPYIEESIDLNKAPIYSSPFTHDENSIVTLSIDESGEIKQTQTPSFCIDKDNSYLSNDNKLILNPKDEDELNKMLEVIKDTRLENTTLYIKTNQDSVSEHKATMAPEYEPLVLNSINQEEMTLEEMIYQEYLKDGMSEEEAKDRVVNAAQYLGNEIEDLQKELDKKEQHSKMENLEQSNNNVNMHLNR